MPRNQSVPAYCLHKPSGQARVIINGRHHYLGPHGSPESRAKYARLIAEQVHIQGATPADMPTRDGFPDLLVAELMVKYLVHAGGYYVKDGTPTGELDNIKAALRPLRELYGDQLAQDFGPKSLKAVRQHMIDVEGLSRKVINARVKVIRRMFKSAVGEELVAPHVLEALKAVDGLRAGRTAAREAEPVGPVSDEWVEKTLGFLPPQVADMVRVQRLTGMRPGEVVLLRPCDIDRTDAVWFFEPPEHKTSYRGHRRRIPIGPKAQTILKPYLHRPPHAYAFSPREAAAWRIAQRAAQSSTRKTPVYPCELRRREAIKKARRRRKKKRVLGERYTRASYYRAVQYGLEKARKSGVDIPHWFNNQLRHTRGTEVRRHHGAEAAQVTLGHVHLQTTEVYAERDLELAKQVAAKTG